MVRSPATVARLVPRPTALCFFFALGASANARAQQPGQASIDCGAAWSPAGDWIAFHSDRTGAWTIYITDTLGKNTRRVLSDTMVSREPAWSPDGHSLAFARGPSGNRNIAIVDLQRGTARQLTSGPGTASWPAWSSDGRTILFDRDSAGTRNVYRIGADGTGLAKLTNGENDQLAKWAARDSIILFSSKRDGQWRVAAMNADGSGQHVLVDGAIPIVSRSGRRLLYQSSPVTGATNLFVMNVDGTGARQVTSGTHSDANASFGPGDASIAFCSNRSGAYRLYIVRAEGGNARLLPAGR